MSDVIAAFKPNKTKLLLLGGGSAAASALCLILAAGLMPDMNLDGVTRAMLWFGVVFFGLLALLWLKQLFDPRAVVEISEEGVRDTRYSPALIPWSAIDSVRLTETQYAEFLTLGMPAAAQAKVPRPWYFRAFDVANAALGYRGIQISMTGLNGTTAELVAAIKAAAPERLKSLV